MTLVTLLSVFICLIVLNFIVDSDSERTRAGYAGLICIVGIICIIINLVTDTNEKIINECQKDLPRSQKCVLIAVPEEIKGE